MASSGGTTSDAGPSSKCSVATGSLGNENLASEGEKREETENALVSEKDDEKEAGSEEETDQPKDQDVDEYPKGLPLAFIVIALVMAIFLASLDMTIVATAIPKITDEFHGLNDVSWYGAAFFMVNGGFQSSWGKAYKYFSLKWTFLACIFVFELGSLICAVAPSSIVLIVGRAITGLGAAGIGTGAYTIIAFVAEPHKRPMFTGFVGMSFGIASAVGPLIGGAFSEHVSWRWCFYINLPVGGASALLILFLFKTPKGAQPVAASWKEKMLQMDPLGIVMIMGAVVAYMLALQYGGQTMPWKSSTVIGLLVGFVLIVIAFGIWETYQGERSMVVPRLFKQRPVGVSCVYTFFFAGSYYLVIYYLPIYFQSVHNVSPAMSGVDNLPLIVATSISMILSGIFISSTGIASPLKVCGAVIAVIAAGLLYTLDIDTSTGKWIGYQILGGVGWGIAFQVPIIVGQSGAEPQDMSSITAMVLFFQCLGGTAFVSAGQSAFVNRLIGTVQTSAPGVDPAAVVATGATQIRTAFAADQVPGLIVAYMAGIKVALAIPIGSTGVALLVSMLSKWKRLNKEAVKEAGGAA
ncbi:hypothetical protein FQN54_008288 [Arachnomyces sp. PD_36]|nr:hypothetical protein FQN54_008288 [Arachnomyces sp. PD_36]